MRRRLSGACVRGRFTALAIGCCASLAAAQEPLKLAPTSDEVRDEVRESRAPRCENASVIVRRCIASQPDQAKSGDRFEQSRQRAKAAFDRRDRAARGARGDDSDASSSGSAQRLAPVVVTGERPEAPLSIEETLQRALQPTLPTGPTNTIWRNDGGRTECVARCVGPACCVTFSPQPNSARDVFSIGR